METEKNIKEAENIELPEAFKTRMKEMLKAEWEEFYYSYMNNRYQALRINRLKKGVLSAQTETKSAELQATASKPAENQVAESKETEPQAAASKPVENQIAESKETEPQAAASKPAENQTAETKSAEPQPTPSKPPQHQENSVPTETIKYETILKKAGINNIDRVEWADDCFYYDSTARPGKHIYHEAGVYYIQEPSAMSVAAYLKPEAGDTVLDLCAAPGGKSTQLAAYMNQKGLLVSNEIHPARCRILSQNIERMGIANAIVTNEDSTHLAEKFPDFFDKILVDAPCSGEGMFRKNPDAIEEWSVENVMLCAKRQAEILDNAAAMLKDGGTLVYSTCTFSREENEETIEEFIKRHKEFCVEKQMRLFPHKNRGEGHFAALLKKSGDKKTSTYKKGKEALTDKNKLALLKAFISETLNEGVGEYILKGNLVLFGEQLYRLPDNAPDLKGIKVLRAGLHIGEFKKERFEPSHALALFLGKEEVKNSEDIELSDIRAEKYLRGETIDTSVKKGWCLVCVDGYSAGWGKAAGGQLKNHYPKGLRKQI